MVFGIVAEKNSVCRLRGSMRTILRSAWMKPRSSIWSASSSTSISIVDRFRKPCSTRSIRPTRRGDEDIDAAADVLAILVDAGAAEHGRDRHLGEFAVLARALGDLTGEFAGRGEDEHPAMRRQDALLRSDEALDRRQHERRGLAGAGLRDAEQIAAFEQDGNGIALDWGRGLDTPWLGGRGRAARRGRDRKRAWICFRLCRARAREQSAHEGRWWLTPRVKREAFANDRGGAWTRCFPLSDHAA